MENMNDLIDLLFSGQQFDTRHRALRLRLAYPDGISDQVLLPQRVHGAESMCGGIAYTMLCVSASSNLPLKSFIGLAAELQFVTDTGTLHGVCGLITEAACGQSDGGLATYQLVLRDVFSSVMALGANSRVFLDKNEIEIAAIVLAGWRERSPLLAAAFDYQICVELAQHQFAQRAFTRQDNESDWAFLQRLFKRRGIAWFVRPGRAMPDDDADGSGAPVHTLVLFDEQRRLPQNAAGTVRYHRADATEQHDSITGWSAVRTLGRGSVSRFSWDYDDPLAAPFMAAGARSRQDQGQRGNRVAIDIDDYRIDPPHAGDTNADHLDLTAARMAGHDYAIKSFHGEGTVRDLRVGEWITLEGHPEIDRHDDDARQFIVTAFRLAARNNLPKALDGRVERLFARNRWHGAPDDGMAELIDTEAQPFRIHFSCSRRSIRIVAPFDPRVDVPPARLHSAIVVGPEGEAVHCDALGRIKIRFPGTRAADHRHAGGAGASGTDTDSAWVRLAMPWAGNGPGSFSQFGAVFLPRAGSEVLVDYLDSDPDRPVIVGQLYNQAGMPAALSSRGALPGNRYLAGLRSREVRGARGNQLRLDDTPGQISVQLASDHGASALNLGWLSTPRADGAGQPRGEGAELRSDEYIALRAARGLLISAWKRIDGTGKQLARDEYAELLRDCGELFATLGKYAQEHLAFGVDAKAQEALTSAFARWENGSNTAPGGAEGGAPVIGLTAPGGIGFATSQAIVSYAATNIDTVAQQHLQLSAGQRFNVNAGKSVSLFAQQEGLTVIANYGKLLMQSQHDSTQIDAAKDVKISAKGRVIIMAEDIVLINSAGAYLSLKDGAPEIGGPGPMQVKTAGHHWDGPASKTAELPTFSEGSFARTPRLLRGSDGQPVKDMELRLQRDGASPVSGTTDAAGAAGKTEADRMQQLVATFRAPRR